MAQSKFLNGTFGCRESLSLMQALNASISDAELTAEAFKDPPPDDAC